MKTKEELIDSIIVNSANFEYCAKKGKINGSLLADIERIMQEYADQQCAINGVVVPKGTLFCGKENKTCEYLKSDNKCGLRKRWCTYQAK